MIADRLAQGLSDARSNGSLTAPMDALRDVFGGGPTVAGPRVGVGSSLAVPAFYSGVKILAETMGSMSCEVRRWDGESTEVSLPVRNSRLWGLLHDEPNPEQEAGDYWECVTTHLGIVGNSYSFMQRDEYGRVVALWPIPPGLVDVQRDQQRRKVFLISPDPDAAVAMPFYSDDVLHFRGFGPGLLKGLSPIGAMRELLARSLSEQAYQSALLANGVRPSGVLQTDNKLDDKKGLRLARRFKRAVGGAHRAGETVILEQGLKWQQVSLSAADAQFIEQREFSTRDVARMLRLPADMLLVQSGGDMHYTSDESVGLRFLAWTMTPWIRRISGPLRVNQNLPWSANPLPGRMFPHFRSDILLRVDRKTRFDAWAVALQNGWMTPDEVRAAEGRVPLGLTKTKPLTGPASKEQRQLPPGDEDETGDVAGDVDALISSVLS